MKSRAVASVMPRSPCHGKELTCRRAALAPRALGLALAGGRPLCVHRAPSRRRDSRLSASASPTLRRPRIGSGRKRRPFRDRPRDPPAVGQKRGPTEGADEAIPAGDAGLLRAHARGQTPRSAPETLCLVRCKSPSPDDPPPRKPRLPMAGDGVYGSLGTATEPG